MKKNQYIFFILLTSFSFNITSFAVAQSSIRLDVATENIEDHVLINKIPNNVNYYSKSKNNKKNVVCNLFTKDSAIIKKINSYKYIITPFFNTIREFDPGLFIYETYRGKIIDSIWFSVKQEPNVVFWENTFKDLIQFGMYKDTSDGILDTLYFQIGYGQGIFPSLYAHILDLKVVEATICLLDSNEILIDSFIINRNYLLFSEKLRMKKIYNDKTKNFKIIKIKNILLESDDKILFRNKWDIFLFSKASIKQGIA